MSVNKVILVGNLGGDPESRTTGSGTVITTLRIATSDRRKDENGQWADATEWHRVVAFGKTAENAARYLKKGRQIYIEGKIRTRQWQDQQGQKRYSTEIVAQQMVMLGRAGDRTEMMEEPVTVPADDFGGGNGPEGLDSANDDDLPF